mmetsp:Transcript_5515/g.16853  ORF Transcript_5515/g.16853 Transcript_5515/m.16853 type:complete len:327 (+) Transcript_5515:1547-2527(+)
MRTHSSAGTPDRGTDRNLGSQKQLAPPARISRSGCGQSRERWETLGSIHPGGIHIRIPCAPAAAPPPPRNWHLREQSSQAHTAARHHHRGEQHSRIQLQKHRTPARPTGDTLHHDAPDQQRSRGKRAIAHRWPGPPHRTPAGVHAQRVCLVRSRSPAAHHRRAEVHRRHPHPRRALGRLATGWRARYGEGCAPGLPSREGKNSDQDGWSPATAPRTASLAVCTGDCHRAVSQTHLQKRLRTPTRVALLFARWSSSSGSPPSGASPSGARGHFDQVRPPAACLAASVGGCAATCCRCCVPSLPRAGHQCRRAASAHLRCAMHISPTR